MGFVNKSILFFMLSLRSTVHVQDSRVAGRTNPLISSISQEQFHDEI